MNRVKKLKIIQITLFFIGIIIVFFTYFERENLNKEKIISSDIQKKINKQLQNPKKDENIFYNIQYSGLDLEGNRYTIKSLEAVNSDVDANVVNMKKVTAAFYFKDGTVLNVLSEHAIYNNKTLDMLFDKKVIATYENSKLYAEKAEFSNSKSFLIISNGVKITDLRGTMFADELLFDIKKKRWI